MPERADVDGSAGVAPGWPDERVRTAVHAAFGLLNSVGTFSSPLTDEELAEQLTGLALAALGSPDARSRPVGDQ